MKRIASNSVLQPVLLTVLVFALSACATSPTGQRQLKLFPDSEIARMGITAYEEVKRQTPVSRDRKVISYVNCVAAAVTRVVPARTAWEVTVFDDKAVNAFALPGGKIGIYTGLLQVAKGQDQLAAVIGHEIAHVIADHGNARVSAAYATQTGLQLAQMMAGAASPQKTQLFPPDPYQRPEPGHARCATIVQAGRIARQATSMWLIFRGG